MKKKTTTTPHCYLCGSKTGRKAKVLRAVVQGSKGTRIYVSAATDPVFCSMLCAANWALVSVHEERRHWCPTQQKWDSDTKQECIHCSPQANHVENYYEEEVEYS